MFLLIPGNLHKTKFLCFSADILIDKEEEPETPKLVLSRGSMMPGDTLAGTDATFNIYCGHASQGGNNTLSTADHEPVNATARY